MAVPTRRAPGRSAGSHTRTDCVLNPASWALAAVDLGDDAAQQAIVRILELSGPALESLQRISGEPS